MKLKILKVMINTIMYITRRLDRISVRLIEIWYETARKNK